MFAQQQTQPVHQSPPSPSKSNPTSGVVVVAQTSNTPTTLGIQLKKNNPWIVDSGVSDHMTGNASFLHDVTPCYEDFMVRIADGSLPKVVGIGSVMISQKLILKSMLLVPTLTCNLISVSKLTRDFKCVANFSHTCCSFQDLALGRMIGNAEECVRLYLLQKVDNPEKQTQIVRDVSFPIFSMSNNESAIMLWHYRLGHPNFLYLKKLFPNLFNKTIAKLLQCEVCQLSKHVRNNYLIQGYKPSQPFTIIQSDIWGPSRVDNISGSRWFVSFIDDRTRVT